MRPSALRPSRRHRSRGQALVEFALVLPLFMLLLTGMLDFGFGLYSRMSVINAAREGARAAVIAPDKKDVPVLVANAVSSAANGLTVSTTVTCIDASPPATCNFTNGSPNEAQEGDSVDVHVAYTYHTFFPLLFGATFDLGTTVRMVLE